MASINVAGLRPVKGEPMPEAMTVTLGQAQTVYVGQGGRQKIPASGFSYMLMAAANSYMNVVFTEYGVSRATQGDKTVQAWRLDTNLNGVTWEGQVQNLGQYPTTLQELRGRKMDIVGTTTGYYITSAASSKKQVQLYDVRPGQSGTGKHFVLFRFTASALKHAKGA